MSRVLGIVSLVLAIHVAVAGSPRAQGLRPADGFALLAAREDAGPGPDLDGEVDASPELRQALRDFYIRTLESELSLSPQQAEALRPRIQALLDAQRAGVTERRTLGVRLLRAARLDLAATGAARAEAAQAVDAVLKAESGERERIEAARKDVLAELNPRQAAGFLGFEDRFQRRLRGIIEQRQRERQGLPPAGEAGPGEGRPGLRPPGPEPGPGQGAPGPGPGPRQGGEDGAGGGDEARRTALIVFTHEVRQRLELTDAQALSMLPKVEELFEARLRGERQRRLLQARLLEAADDPASTDADLRALAAEALEHDREASGRIAQARAAATSDLSPVQAARFLALEHRAERELRDQARRAREGWPKAGAGPRGPGGGGRLGPGGGGRLGPGGADRRGPDGGGGRQGQGGAQHSPPRGDAPRMGDPRR